MVKLLHACSKMWKSEESPKKMQVSDEPTLLREGCSKCMPNGVILLETVHRRWCDTIVVEGVGVRPATMV